MNDFYIILTACLVAINCAIMGSFLVMRKMVMIGDAISHAGQKIWLATNSLGTCSIALRTWNCCSLFTSKVTVSQSRDRNGHVAFKIV